MSVGLSERPKPARSGAMQRWPASRTGGITLRHRYDQVGSPWKKIDRRALALVDVGEPQAVDLAVVRLEVEARQVLEALLGCADDLGRGSSSQYLATPSSVTVPFWPSSVLWSKASTVPLIPRNLPVPPVNVAVPVNVISEPVIA